MTVYEKISSLLTAANAATGESDPDLTAAVQRLIDGYGQSGNFDCGTFTIISAPSATPQYIDITHSLGSVPKKIIVFPYYASGTVEHVSLKLLFAAGYSDKSFESPNENFISIRKEKISTSEHFQFYNDASQSAMISNITSTGFRFGDVTSYKLARAGYAWAVFGD